MSSVCVIHGDACAAWFAGHDRDIRRRLLRGDEDTVVNWLLFGTSFTQQPKVFFEVSSPVDNLRRLISSRTQDLISALASPDTNERIVFARQLLAGQGYRFETMD